MPEVSTRDPQFRRSIPMDPVLRDRLRRIAWAEQGSLQAQGSVMLADAVKAWIKKNGEPPLTLREVKK